MDRPELIKDNKPITPQKREQIRDIVKTFLLADWLEKRDIMNKHNLCERTARDCISYIAKKVPVIATSNKSGYRIARTLKDSEDVKHTLKELESRKKELEEREKPLKEFLEKFSKETEHGKT